MSSYMDDVDRELIKSLFPEYLLQQPIAYSLWMAYYRHKKVFHKMKHNGINDLGKQQLLTKESGHNKLSNKLSYSVRKEIWQKLMSLGVLGTLSFDSANDEYLVQVYKYFYPGPSNNWSAGAGSGALPGGSIGMQNATGNSDDIEDLVKPAVTDEDILEDLAVQNAEDIREGDNRGNMAIEDDDDDDDEEDDDDDDEEDENDNDDEEDNGEESVGFRRGGNSSATDEDNLGGSADPTRSPKQETMHFYPALSAQSYPTKPKNNNMSSEVYQMLNYSLPSRWVTQANNCVLVSADGISQLGPNPNWQAYMAYERSSASTRNRLRSSFSGNQKNDFAVTWANNFLHLNEHGIFYYEIRVLSVTSSQGAQNSNIIVGYKCWPDSEVGGTSSKVDGEHGGSTASAGSSMGAGLRSSARSGGGPTGSSGNVDDPSSSGKTGIEDGFFGYRGSDGSITAGSQYKSYSKPFGRDDVIGCGVNYVDGTIFFTKNGVFLGTAFTDFHEVNLIPYIALRQGNTVRTNFGLYEEFVFDILGYQSRWKAKAYKHIFKSIDEDDVMDEFDLSDEETDNKDQTDDKYMDVDNDDPQGIDSDTACIKDSLLLRDTRFNGDQLSKPDVEKINNLNAGDDSVPSTLHTMINDYLIHEGLIDVAKGFLKDLQKDTVRDSSDDRGAAVIRHNERQIVKEEKNLKIRQDLRRFITEGSISQCLSYIESQLPGLLQENVELLFEIKVAQYLLTILHYRKYSIEAIVSKGQELSREFVYNDSVPDELKEKFRAQLSNVSALLAYDDPANESPEELATYLSNDYLQDRLFQVINTNILKFLKKNSDCKLETVIRYTRAMLATLMAYNVEGSSVHNGTELRYFKILNIDEDLLNL
ncbi:ZYBA0S05-01090g1_1 [Zygosaccharomyces bailii CLIB 213]|uniref:ZYBA0S05-01090g1_1 n=1 Tax=Zygosaccharomyces bailii (strain CLIB 213 / ATCC 58445 / CBS 680 / BCRC 21525 / NBRC 1098 / NCYC 1416 / NRRL Y-2227) TaxID=1333698 RepID=A0A8J2T7K4_ZYGB2|nr:ZYBA0S05-01090g1_1 [Zygosaccharomyces bailii CLIB 213]